MENKILRVISLGAGVQSSTVLLMALAGEFDVMPDCAVFADPKNERKETYEYLRYLKGICKEHSFPLHVISKGNLIKDALNTTTASIPFFTKNPDGSRGVLGRHCTQDYKIVPVQQFIKRKLFGLRPRQRVPDDMRCEQWIGISSDEASRMKDSRDYWTTNVYPLIDKVTRSMSRADCVAWLEGHGYKLPPQSSCIFCPFHNDGNWSELMAEPNTRRRLVQIDRAIRHGKQGVDNPLYLHPSLLPLDEVEFGRWKQQLKEREGQGNMFINECDGVCGV